MNTAWNRWCRNLPSGTALSLYDNRITPFMITDITGRRNVRIQNPYTCTTSSGQNYSRMCTCACAMCCYGYCLWAGPSRRNTVPSSLWCLQDFCCCCSCYCLPRTSLLVRWRPGALCISVWPKNFMFQSIAAHDLIYWMQEIQFLELMGGSNSTHAHSDLHAF